MLIRLIGITRKRFSDPKCHIKYRRKPPSSPRKVYPIIVNMIIAIAINIADAQRLKSKDVIFFLIRIAREKNTTAIVVNSAMSSKPGG